MTFYVTPEGVAEYLGQATSDHIADLEAEANELSDLLVEKGLALLAHKEALIQANNLIADQALELGVLDSKLDSGARLLNLALATIEDLLDQLGGAHQEIQDLQYDKDNLVQENADLRDSLDYEVNECEAGLTKADKMEGVLREVIIVADEARDATQPDYANGDLYTLRYALASVADLAEGVLGV